MATLTIAAAASLLPALQDMQPELERLFPFDDQFIIDGSSGSLVNQIVNGVIHPDIFISAALEPMEELVDEGFVTSGKEAPLLRNSLVLIRNKVNTPATQNIISFNQVTYDNTTAKNVRIYIPEPETVGGVVYEVPAGRYARRAFNYFGNWAFAGQAAHRLDDDTPAAPIFSVARARNLVAGRTTSAAIGTVYFTDAMTAPWRDSLEIIAIAPPSVNSDIIYPIAPLSASPISSHVMTNILNFIKGDGIHYFYDRGFLPLISAN